MEIITAIIGSGALSAVIAGIFNAWNNRKNRKTDESKLLMGIAYSKIIQTAEHHIKEGYISVEEYNELNRYLFEPYKSMGGNGTAERLMNEVKNLPTEKREAQ